MLICSSSRSREDLSRNHVSFISWQNASDAAHKYRSVTAVTQRAEDAAPSSLDRVWPLCVYRKEVVHLWKIALFSWLPFWTRLHFDLSPSLLARAAPASDSVDTSALPPFPTTGLRSGSLRRPIRLPHLTYRSQIDPLVQNLSMNGQTWPPHDETLSEHSLQTYSPNERFYFP